MKYQASTIAAGIYTVNEWRRAENKEPIKGGDLVLVSANLKSIDEVANPTTSNEYSNNSEEDETGNKE